MCGISGQRLVSCVWTPNWTGVGSRWTQECVISLQFDTDNKLGLFAEKTGLWTVHLWMYRYLPLNAKRTSSKNPLNKAKLELKVKFNNREEIFSIIFRNQPAIWILSIFGLNGTHLHYGQGAESAIRTAASSIVVSFRTQVLNKGWYWGRIAEKCISVPLQLQSVCGAWTVVSVASCTGESRFFLCPK